MGQGLEEVGLEALEVSGGSPGHGPQIYINILI
jgi:hypothetical protein